MAKNIFTTEANSQLATLVRSAAESGEPLYIHADGEVFKVSIDMPLIDLKDEREDPWKDYDPEKVREALRESRGALAGVDTDQLMKDIMDARGQDPLTRPY
jgi:hypothetical protein